MGRYSLERPSEIWTYNNLPIPSVPASLDITFVDFKGTGDFEIVSDLESTAPIVMQFGTAESNLLALAMRRNRLGMEDPRTGLGRFRDVDATPADDGVSSIYSNSSSRFKDPRESFSSRRPWNLGPVSGVYRFKQPWAWSIRLRGSSVSL